MGKNMLKLDTRGFKQYAEKLDALGGDLQMIFTDALEQAGETIANDTLDAITDPNLPRGGKYRKSPSKTEASVVRNPKIEWHGTLGEIGVGFDFNKPGAGGYLITGTPRMRPDNALDAIYKKKKYMNDISKGMVNIFNDEIKRRMGG